MAGALEIKLVGGLGNQLFQYAAGRSLCVKKGVSSFLLNTESYYNDPFGRVCSLMHYKIKGEFVKGFFVKNLLRKNTRLNKLFSVFPFYQIIEENGLKLHSLESHTGLFTSLRGYWQSEYYFKEIRESLLNELVPLHTPPLPSWLGPSAVAVHVRRTDYLREKRFGFLGEAYYRSAMDLVREQVVDPFFVFFSDDLGWCKDVFGNEPNVLFAEEKEWAADFLQLYLMSRCAHQIIANSSFSWWSGWLNSHPGKMVVRPAIPFADSTLMYEGYYPAEWMSVANRHELAVPS